MQLQDLDEDDLRWVGTNLVQKRCVACEGVVRRLSERDAQRLLGSVAEWTLTSAGTELVREVRFTTHLEAMSFVGAVGWVSHSEDHHPVLEWYYTRVVLRLTTHAVKGLTENDFICAAKIEQLLSQGDRAA